MISHLFQIPSDRRGFSRRECPRCRAHFKVPQDARAARLLAAALVQEIAHLNDVEAEAGPERRHCPYCGYVAAAGDWWTDEQRRYVKERADLLSREVSRRRAGMSRDRLEPADPLPMRGEPDDMELITLPCCGERQKVVDSWRGPVRCHFCGAVHSCTGGRDIGLELALLREWTEVA